MKVMQINVTSGIGTSPTELATFDAALNASSIANYGSLQLRSVIALSPQVVKLDQWLDQLSSRVYRGLL